MKKLLICYLLFFCILPLWSEEEFLSQIQPEEKTDSTLLQPEEETDGTPLEPEEETPPEEEEEEEKKIPLRLKNRGFEIVLVDLNAGFGNSFLAAIDILQETAVVNLDDFTRGFKADLGVHLTPVAININWKDKWGFGFDLAKVSVFGNVDLPENLLQLHQAKNELFGAGAAVFVDVGIPTFFHIKKLKLTVRPAVFLPVAYAEPNIKYTFTEKNNGILIDVNYDMHIYSSLSLSKIISGSFDFKEIPDALNISTMGFDFNLGFEYPLFSWLDIGVDMQNIPIKLSVLNQYMRLKGKAFFDSSVIDIADLISGGEFPDNAFGYPEDFTPTYGSGEKKILRPFKFLASAVYKPLKNPLLALIPSIGFSLSPLYATIASVEGGLKFRVDLANMFITTIGIGYEDRLWRNSVNFVINLKLIELDFGAAVESEDFVKSWQGAGARVYFALKLGW